MLEQEARSVQNYEELKEMVVKMATLMDEK